MDPLFHSVSGIVLAQILPGHHYVTGIIATNFPDIMCAPYAYGYRALHARKDSIQHFFNDIFDNSRPVETPIDYMSVYRATHSLAFWLSVSIASWFVLPERWLLISLGILFHLLADIPSHEGQYATRLLYPFSQAHISWGKNWTQNQKVFLGLWIGLLLVIFSLVFIRN